MRRLVYTIINKSGNEIYSTTSYAEAEKAKEVGYSYKISLVSCFTPLSKMEKKWMKKRAGLV